MKKLLYLTLLSGLVLITRGQQKSFTKTPALGIHLSFLDFSGADSLRSFGRHMKPGLALSFQNNLSKQTDYSFMVAGSFLDFIDRRKRSLGEGKKQLLLQTDASVRAKLLPPGTLFNPYAQVGAGISVYKNYWGMFIPAGLGCQVNITQNLFVLVNSQYHMPVTNTQHRHFYHSIGLAGTIYRKKISKAKPMPPLPVANAKPIDSDGDGIVDSVDQCPSVIGLARYHGCPAPDRDGDKIIDDEDLCPDVKGLVQYNGCPAPDKDSDGIEDALDKCPDVAGYAGNNGCPEIKKAVRDKMDQAARQIFFATGSFQLLPKSFAALNDVAQLLKEDQALQLTINGHTDNTGTPETNQVLSENRAGAVMHYLEKAGIANTRLHAAGYGERQPVAENTTANGRAANRRVELHVAY